MKTRMTLAACVLIVAIIGAAPAMAQVANPQHSATIPFAFQVGNTQLPAGEYAITQFGNQVQVRHIAGGGSVTVAAIPFVGRQTADAGHLQFERKGDTLVLSNLYFAGREDGVQLLNPKIRAASRM